EAKTLLGALDAAPDPTDARLRLRSALRRIVDSIWLLVVPRGQTRLFAVQVWFAEGKRHRDYLILHQAAKANGRTRTEAYWRACSLSEVIQPGALDLRKREDAARLETGLLALDLTTL